MAEVAVSAEVAVVGAGLSGLAAARALVDAGREVVVRRAAVLACFEKLFGPDAAHPVDYAEQEWASEEWSGGGPTSNFAPGGWSECGGALRRPVGQIHWAGTETATIWSGYMEGALQAGDRAAAEVLARLTDRAASLA